MSADAKGKKRKSGDNIVSAAKKIKTAETNVAKSADRPAPVKSALKKTNIETVKERPSGKKFKTFTKTVAEPDEDIEEVETVVSDNEEGGAALSADQTDALLAGFSSSEDDDDGDQDEGLDIAKLPAPPVAKSKKSSPKPTDTSDPETTPGVIYMGRLPHGFFEKQLQAYLTQFGSISNLRLARNKKTGKSKHYAFIEFESASVADIVAKTMDKYLMFGHILQVRRVPAEQVKEGMWKGPKSVKKGKVRPRNRIEGTRLRKGTDREGWEKRVTREQERRQVKADKLKEIGYDFDMPDVKAVTSVGEMKQVEAGATEVVEEPEEGVKLIEGKKKKKGSKGSDKEVERVVEVEQDGNKTTVTEEKTVKRKNKAIKAEITTKKRKLKATA